jgi:5-methylcytosine-specific restriction endonuclease McrA
MENNMFDQDKIEQLRSNIAVLAKTEDEAHMIIQILAETDWLPLITKEQLSVRKQQDFFQQLYEEEKKLRKAHREAHQNDPTLCPRCRKIFPRHQLGHPRFRGKGYTRRIPERANIFCCQRCREAILKEYVYTCKICGKEDIAANSQQTCRECWWKDPINILRQVKTQIARAKKSNTAATLTVSEWKTTIEHFQGLCAYCKRHPVEALDHFVPITRGGGTTADNCVPICSSCNRRKSNYNPNDDSELIYMFPEITTAKLERVRAYLESQRLA